MEHFTFSMATNMQVTFLVTFSNMFCHCCDQIDFVGDWKEGSKHGRGEYCLKDGCKYFGDWRDNKRQGKGVFVWSDGSVYDGEWENDLR